MSETSGPASTRPRDQDDTGFTRHLNTLLKQVPEALCAAFVDGEGETVDFASRLDPFDARIAAAEMAIILHSARYSGGQQGHGAVLELRIECGERSIIARHVSEGYDLVMMVSGDTISARAAEMAAATAISLMVEAGLPPPASYAVVRSMEHRTNQKGLQVPHAFDEGGVRRRIEAVLGHALEGDSVQFLVRLDNGEEMVLSHEQTTGRWQRAR